MAKENQDIDRIFREKLAANSVRPSPMAWEKLEGRLSRKKKGIAPWMRIAVTLLLLFGLTALLWLSIQNAPKELDTVANQAPVPEIIRQETAVTPESPTLEDQAEEENSPIEPPEVKKSPSIEVKSNLAVVQSEEPEPITKQSIPVQQVTPIELPPLDTDLLVAENTIAEPEEVVSQEVAYKITIISNGIRTTPEKETLVAEIENKIDKIGGLLGKVDQGFADLQDAKNNLFASITTRNK